MPFRPIHIGPDLGLVEVPCLQFSALSRDLFLVLACHCLCAVTVSLTCSSYHAAAVVAALDFIGLIHVGIGLIHLHNQVVRVHREEILLSERGPVLFVRCEVILIL